MAHSLIATQRRLAPDMHRCLRAIIDKGYEAKAEWHEAIRILTMLDGKHPGPGRHADLVRTQHETDILLKSAHAVGKYWLDHFINERRHNLLFFPSLEGLHE